MMSSGKPLAATGCAMFAIVMMIAMMITVCDSAPSTLCGYDWADQTAVERKIYPVCLSVRSGANGTASKMMFYPKVDQFTLLQINNTWGTEFTSNASSLALEVAGALSSDQVFRLNRTDISGDSTDGKTTVVKNLAVPFLTAIIILDQGVIKNVTWDTGCSACDSLSCIRSFEVGYATDDICGVPPSDCDNKTYDCSIRVYIAWLGTDAKGNYLTSAGQRPSRFRQYSLKSVYDSAASQAANIGQAGSQITDEFRGDI